MAVNGSLNGLKKTFSGHFYERATPTAKRISLKSLTSGCNGELALPIFEQGWLKLRKSTIAVLESRPVEVTLEELYRSVEDICTNKMISDLYSSMKTILREYVAQLLPSLMKEGIKLTILAHSWKTYCGKMLLIRNIFLFMDRQLIMNSSQNMQIWDLTLHLFREEVIAHEAIQQSLIKQLLEEIYKERTGEVIDRQLMRTIIRMLSDLKLYRPVFLHEFCRQSQQFYAHESDLLLRQLSVPEYLVHVDRRIKEEEDRLAAYLDDACTREPLLDGLVSEMLTRPLDHLLDTGLVNALKARATGHLKLLYVLLSRVPNGIDKLRTHFRLYVTNVGRDFVDNPTSDVEKDRLMIQNLLDCREHLSNLITTCFDNDASFTRVVQESFEEFINQRPNKPAEFLAKYLDSYLRSGNKTQSEEELDKLMDKSMVLFRYIQGKDIFEAFYTKELAKRLLLNKSASIDAEKAMLSKLKQECGPNYTRKMETMFQDIELSRQLSKNFRATMCASDKSPSIELSVNVICPASWPPYVQSSANYPAEMVALRDEFNSFYLSHHQGRKLIYEPSLGTCVVKARLPASPNLRKELMVSEFQALVLLQFNDDAQLPVTYASVLEATGIEETELKRTLLSLSAGRGQRILVKQPYTMDVQPNHVFYLNKDFEPRLTRIKFNQIQLKETKQEQEATEERVFADRVAHVDCCIVRIMKTRKSIDHNSLLTEVYKQLQFPLKASDVKKRIENLIERDYMKRDGGSASTYHYVS